MSYRLQITQITVKKELNKNWKRIEKEPKKNRKKLKKDGGSLLLLYNTGQKGFRVRQGLLHNGDLALRKPGDKMRKKRVKSKGRRSGKSTLPRFSQLAAALYWIVRLIREVLEWRSR
jgi:hypothetical protein